MAPQPPQPDRLKKSFMEIHPGRVPAKKIKRTSLRPVSCATDRRLTLA